MPEISMEESNGDIHLKQSSNGQYYLPHKEIFDEASPRSPLSTHTPESDSIDLAVDGGFENSIEQLYDNVCEMQSSDPSPSRRSYLSYGADSRIDSELRFLAGVDFLEIKEDRNGNFETEVKESRPASAKSVSTAKGKPSPNSKSPLERPPTGKRNGKNHRKLNPKSTKNGIATDDHTYLGPYLLKQARDSENPQKALDLALRAVKSFENCENEKPNLEFVMCLHIVASLYCRNGQYGEAIPVLERSIEMPAMEEGQSHALAKFAGCMQLGDTYAMIGQIENSILCYTAGMEIQRQALGEKDIRFGETCRYVAEAHVQAMQFDEAQKLCQMALDIHRETASPASPEEAADRRLMGLICDSKGNHEASLEHYVLAGMAMAANGNETDVASIDSNIGDAYLSLSRYDEAIHSYQKALTIFKSTRGENHPSVASVFVRLADLYNKIGKFRESKSYSENALRIYAKPLPGTPPEDIAAGLIDISAIYESMNEHDEALALLRKALKVYGDVPGQQCTIAAIEAQMGVLYYILGSYSESYDSFKKAVAKFRGSGDKKSALFGIALNQMGLACVQLYAINEAADLFEEARSVLESEYGPYHPDTLGVYSNLAGTYDALGRTADAIEILEFVVGMREEKLGTANPDVNDEKRRLAELLKESGRVRNRKSIALETLLDTTNIRTFTRGGEIKVL